MDRLYICTSCGKLKPLSQFTKDTARKSGRRAVCYECHNRSLHEDIQLKVAYALRAKTRAFMRQETKTGKELIGCSKEKFLSHIGKQFSEGMTWENYGEWELDHIIPCDAFDLSDPEQQAMCFHYSNFRPMWFHDNRSKGKRWSKQFPLAFY